MDDLNRFNFILKSHNWRVKILFWGISALLLFFLFTSNAYNLEIRIILVAVLLLMSIAASYFINNYLIPIYLFNGKFLKFIYLLIYTIVISFWINFISLILILVYTIFYLPQIIVPQYSDIILLFSGTYLIILLSAIFHFIKESYRRLVEKNDIEKQKQLTEIKLKEARLKLLKGQINPHFLFNMLNNLYGLVKESADESREVIVKLSDLLDYMLYECDKLKVSLKREIKFIQDYIELERIRHDEHFNVKTSFPNLNEDILIVPLILFPFVENAFKHGFHDPEKSKLNMEISVNSNSLFFFIENSITKNTEDQYLKQEGKGIGLKNIQERLELIYKDKYQLDILNKENTFVVKLEINLE